jgi:hypothetical protein
MTNSIESPLIRTPKAGEIPETHRVEPDALQPETENEPTEVLFPEAKQRERRRRLIVLATLVAIGGLIAGLIAAFGGSPPRTTNPRGAESSSVALTSRAPTIPKDAMQAPYDMVLDGSHGLIVANSGGVFITLDAGHHWANITPEDLNGLYEHIAKIDVVGDHIWLGLSGASVFGFMPYSLNGGRSWKSHRFGSCTFPSDLTFSSANDGTVEVQTCSGKSSWWATANAGVSWHEIPKPSGTVTSPNSNTSVPTNGRVPVGLTLASVLRAGKDLAWAQATGPMKDHFTPTYLVQSTNDGRTWNWVSQSQ